MILHAFISRMPPVANAPYCTPKLTNSQLLGERDIYLLIRDAAECHYATCLRNFTMREMLSIRQAAILFSLPKALMPPCLRALSQTSYILRESA